MAGIAGRSKGCRTCYRRHVKCDETHPYCLRCQKARITCDGYRGQTFISYEVGQAGPQRLSISPRRNAEPAETKTTSTNTESSRIDRPLPLIVSDDVCISYARAHLPSDWCLEPQWHTASTQASDEAADLDQHLLEFALRSLARTLFAYRKQHSKLLKEGLSLYRRVLSAVNRALASANCVQRLDLVESILALRAFDSFIPLNTGAWIHHSRGVESILALRGACAHRDPAVRRVLEHARPQIIMASLKEGTPTILADVDWKVIPWADETVVKGSPKYLIDILADISALAHARGKRPGAVSDDDRDWRNQQAIQVLRDLQQWRASWEVEYPMILSQTHFDCPLNLNIHPFWSHDIAFTSSEHAAWAVTYDAICVIALVSLFNDEIQRLQCNHTEPLTDSNFGINKPFLDDQDFISCISTMFHHALLESCKATSYYFQAVKGMDHPIDVLIPLRQVWRNTRRSKCSCAAWLDDTMGKIASYGFDGIPLTIDDH